MSEELKPCPFCGAQGRVGDAAPACDPSAHNYFIECELDCGAVHQTIETAIIEWNTRPIEDALRARIAKLESQLESEYLEAARVIFKLAGIVQRQPTPEEIEYGKELEEEYMPRQVWTDRHITALIELIRNANRPPAPPDDPQAPHSRAVL